MIPLSVLVDHFHNITGSRVDKKSSVINDQVAVCDIGHQ